MNNEIILKHFINDGKIYELVYVIDPSFKDATPQELKNELDESIQKASLTVLSLDTLTFEDCQVLIQQQLVRNERVKELDSKISQLIQRLQIEIVKETYGKQTIDLFKEFLNTWATDYLSTTELSALTRLDTYQKKLEYLNSNLPRLIHNLTPSSKKQKLPKDLIDRFSEFLKQPQVLSSLTPTRLGSYLSIIGLSLTPQTSNISTILKTIHPFLSENKELLKHLKIFKNRDSTIGLSILQSDPGVSTTSTYQFLHNLELFLSQPYRPKQKLWSYDSIMQDPKLALRPPVATNLDTDFNLNPIPFINSDFPEPITPTQDKIKSLKKKLSEEIDRGFHFLDNTGNFLNRLESYSENAQLEILSFLRPQTLDHLQVTELEDSKVCQSIPINYHFQVSLNPPHEYQLNLEAETLIYTQDKKYHRAQATSLTIKATTDEAPLEATAREFNFDMSPEQKTGLDCYLTLHSLTSAKDLSAFNLI